MKRLGYKKYVAQGGDWGNAISEIMALMAPPELLGHPHQYACYGSGRYYQKPWPQVPFRLILQPMKRMRTSSWTFSIRKA